MSDATKIETQILTCQECRSQWLDGHQRWRLYLTEDAPPFALVYCPDCASREFDPD
jgi:hypothetical protein